MTDTTKIEIRRTVLNQLEAIRMVGSTNMIDRRTVRYIADEIGADELRDWIDEHPKAYGTLIMRGPDTFTIIEEG